MSSRMGETTFSPTNTSKTHLQEKQLPQEKTSECWRRTQIPREMHGHLGLCPPQGCTWDPEQPGPGADAWDTWPTFDDMLAEHMIFPGLDLDVHTALSYSNPTVAHPLGAPPTCVLVVLLVVSVCLHTAHNWARSPNKWPLLPTHVRAEIRHWKELQSEEGKENKERKKGNHREVSDATD